MDSSAYAELRGLGGASDRTATATPSTPAKEKVKEVQNELFEEEEEDVEEKETVDEELFPEDHAGYQEPRVVAINRPDLNMHYKFKNNYVSTTKYNFWNFIPKNLFEQFRRVANVYFLIIAIVTLTPPSPVKPGAFLLALVIVLGATAIKEAVEDWKRYQSDRRVNSRLCEVLRRKEDGGTDKWEYVEWADVVVGDLVRVKNWQPFPSDLLLISSSSADGQCYIETSNLDGETNLKVRQAVKETTGLTLMKDLALLKGYVECDAPNEDLYKFDGSLTLELQESHALQVALDTNQVLLRGSVLRNTEWIIGVVLYTGHQTKYMLSTTDPPSKQSRVEKLMNRLIIIVLLAEIGIVIASAILGAVWEQANGKDMWFLDLKRHLFVQIFENLFTFLVLYSPMVPISLYVTLEFVRVFQAGFIESDIAMYHEETNTPALARTSNLNEELGQIDYVFSDKTGTLTCNQMVFRVCTVGGTIYGEIPDLSAPSPSSTSLSSSSAGVSAARPSKSRAELVLAHDAAVHSDGEEEIELDEFGHSEGGAGAGVSGLTNGMGHSSPHMSNGSARGTQRAAPVKTPDIEFDDPTIFEHIDDVSHPNSFLTREFFTVLAVCHSVMPEVITKKNTEAEEARLKKLRHKTKKQKKSLYLRPKNYNKLDDESSGVDSDEGEKNGADETAEEEAEEQNGSEEPVAQGLKEVRYQAASPDENALVAAAKYFGFYFHTRAHNTVTVNIMGEDLDFEVLNVMEFTSNRKRMSVVVRTPDGQFKLFTKGADNVVYDRLRKNDPSAKVTAQQLHQFACAGLRTLCIAERVLDPVMYRAWNARFQKASLSFNGRKTKLDLLAEEIEVDLELIGATGIEDKLQDGVPETIESLLEAGIKVWVLTGDKRETAINVGKACNLLKSNMVTLVISSNTKIATKQRLEYLLSLIATKRWALLAKEHERDDTEVPSVDDGVSSTETGTARTVKPDIALVIEGRTLVYALEYDLKFALLSLAQQCHTVVCCRTTPMQKTLMVKLVKDSETPETLTPKEKIQLELRKTAGYLTNRKKVTTLAIGDGANDVPMIQAAHVGIGISGREGMQAVLASDYAIAQFRFLKRLLFVHGRYSYKRMALLVLYFFYKNMLIALINFWWSFFTGFSGQTVWDSYLGIGFNLIFTCLPVVVCAVMDMDVPIKALDRYPRLYRDGQLNISLHTGIFLRWMLMAVVSSFLITTISIAVFNSASVYGLVLGLWDVNTVIYTGTVLVANLRLALASSMWTKMHHVVMWSSIISWFIVASIYCSNVALYLAPDMFWVIFNLFSVPTFWFVMPILCIICLLPDIIWDFVMRTYFPSNYQVVQEIYRVEEEAKRKQQLGTPQLTLQETA